MTRVWRLPMLLLVPVLIVGAVLVQDRRASTTATDERLDAAVATVSSPGAPSSTWYCAAGTATGTADGYAEQTVIVSNATSEDSTGLVTGYTDTGAQASRAISVKAHGSTSIRTSDVIKAPWAAMVVEVAGGGIAVVQEIRGASGRSVDDCSSSPSSDWWFPVGNTRAGTKLTLALFNPFPGEATVDVAFDTEDGARTPQQFQGMVVRGGHLAVVDISAVVTLRERVATTVTVRSGRIVAREVLSSDGRNGTETGLASIDGATIAAPVWTFPVATPASVTAKEIVAITNPGDVDADIQIQVQLDDPATNGSVEPFVASVPAGRSLTIDLGADPRIPRTVGRWLIVRSTAGQPIVVGRSIGAPKSGATGGLTTTIGVPIVSTTWVGAMGVPADTAPALLSIANPSATLQASVTLTMHRGGRSADIASVVDVIVAPGQRIVVDLQKLIGGRTDGPYEVTSNVPVVVGQWLSFTAPVDFSTSGAFPFAGTLSFPVDVFSPEAAEFVEIEPRTEDTVATTTTTTVEAVTTTTVAGATTTVAGATTTIAPN